MVPDHCLEAGHDALPCLARNTRTNSRDAAAVDADEKDSDGVNFAVIVKPKRRAHIVPLWPLYCFDSRSVRDPSWDPKCAHFWHS